MFGTIAITDFGWYSYLLQQSGISEVNFWTPSARRSFRAESFSPFLFKLKAPHNSICGFGYFARYSKLPDWLAWDSFGIGNGCESLAAMKNRIAGIRERIGYQEAGDLNQIGCILIVSPVFFPRESWIPQPRDWPARTLTPVRYDLSQGEGQRIWDECVARVRAEEPALDAPAAHHAAEQRPRYGTPKLVEPRLGQGTFRIVVTEAYERACAVTGEHSLPALDAAHIKPYSDAGPHEARNGLLLRADLHRLFDLGYISVSRDLRLTVSPRLKKDFQNGRSYYPLDGAPIRSPSNDHERPAPEFLEWHRDRIYLG